MICNYCGTEIANHLKQCPECGMPTENLEMPAPVAINTKKKKKKFDPNEIKPNTLGNVSVLTAFASVALGLLASLFGIAGVLFHFLLTSVPLVGLIFAIISISFFGIGLIAAIVALVMALKGRQKKDLPQASPLVGLCFSVLGIIFTACSILLLVLYVLI